jgi:hypothetical protein
MGAHQRRKGRKFIWQLFIECYSVSLNQEGYPVEMSH